MAAARSTTKKTVHKSQAKTPDRRKRACEMPTTSWVGWMTRVYSCPGSNLRRHTIALFPMSRRDLRRIMDDEKLGLAPRMAAKLCLATRGRVSRKTPVCLADFLRRVARDAKTFYGDQAGKA